MPKKENFSPLLTFLFQNPLYIRFEGQKLADRFGDEENVVRVKKIPLPDFTFSEQLGRREGFSLFIQSHVSMAVQLVETFMSVDTVEELLSLASYCRDRVNPYLFGYALSVALMHRNDTKYLSLPPHLQAFPEKFISESALSLATEESSIANDAERLPVELPTGRTASDLEPENKLWYFREDIGMNLAHWNWHLAHPARGETRVVKKDRRGELFYYFHQQILARLVQLYNFERFCNNLPRTKKLGDWRSPIEEGYFPKLDTLVSSKNWPPRFSNIRLRVGIAIIRIVLHTIQDIIELHPLFFRFMSIMEHLPFKRKTVSLNNSRGINILGNTVESSVLSVNANFYGNLHNFGHLAIAFCHDPDNRFLESFGVMGDSATSMRDPVFYRWHAFINGIFVEHKNSLPPYTKEKLSFTDVQVLWTEVNTLGGSKNKFITFLQQSDIDISGGLDFTPKGPMPIRITHLQHAPFTYRIRVANKGPQRIGTVRIFLAPKEDERGHTMTFNEQRHFWIEMDRFIATNKLLLSIVRNGNRTLLRRSNESSVTIPLERTFSSMGKTGSQQYCSCGWPHNLLVPKGSLQGIEAQLFVMISDYETDRVNQGDVSQNGCADSPAYCGVRDARYPDKKPMGFPFDRPGPRGVRFISHFLLPNMALTPIKIYFKNVTLTLQTQSLAIADW
ncbi:hypothetical protein AAG570_008718 [Ranatra chinensis]|uniref:Prophenoloxidase n=1 Tax=Ranatra chinensis TaxID=642074 RepID=A0ABD0YRT7_9HEMI